MLADLPNAKAYRMELALTDIIDLHRYPFDTQPVEILLASADRPTSFTSLSITNRLAWVMIQLQGWEVDPNWHARAAVMPNGPFAQHSIPAYEFRGHAGAASARRLLQDDLAGAWRS